MTKQFGVIMVTTIQFLRLALGFNQNPKLYADVDCIKLVDPLLHGFNVYVPEDLFQTHLDPFQIPILYVTAVPLKPGVDGNALAVRKIVYMEHIPNKMISIEGLADQTWYFICLEYENVHRLNRLGNTSTSCQIHRTLDSFGKADESAVREVALGRVTDSVLEFRMELEAAYPMLLDARLEHGSGALQTFYLSGDAKSLRVIFSNLVPGFNYGRLCLDERPLLQTYTALGRSIHVSKSTCHLDHLETVPWKISEDKPAPMFRKLLTLSNTSASLNNKWIFLYQSVLILMFLMVCV